MALWNFTIKEVRRRPGRTALALASVVVGVAAVVAVSLATSTTRRAYEEMYRAVAGRAAFEVVAEGNQKFDHALAARLEQVEGVAAAAPSLQGFTVVFAGAARFRLLAVGIDPQRDRLARDYERVEGQSLDGSNGAMIGADTAEAAAIRPGDEVRLLTRGRPSLAKVRIAGTFRPRGAAGISPLGMILLPMAWMQRHFAAPGKIDTISVVLDGSAQEDRVLERIRRVLPGGLYLRPAWARAQLGRETFLSAEQGLQFACAVTIVLGAFIILNAFLMNVQERRGQLAILRALGATRRQIARMLLGEAIGLGLLGTLLGLLAGLGGAKLLVASLAGLSDVPPPAMQLTWLPFALAATLGPGMALLGALVPARLAGRVSPLDALRAAADGGRGSSATMAAAGLAVFVFAGLVLAACTLDWLPTWLSIPAGVVFLAAFVPVIPAVLGPATAVIGWLLRPILGAEGRLARRQLLGRRTRSGLTVGALYLAVGAGVGLGTGIVNNVRDVRQWYRRTLTGDFFIRAMAPDPATGLAVPMDTSLRDAVAATDGIASVGMVRLLNVQVAGRAALVVAMDLPPTGPLPLHLAQGRPDEVLAAMQGGEAVLGSALAHRAGIAVGDSVPLETTQGRHALAVAGTAIEYMVGGQTIYLHRQAAERIFHCDGADLLVVRAAPGRLAEVERRLRDLCRQEGLLLHSFAQIGEYLEGIMSAVVSGLWALLVLGFVVAALGIAGTLTMNVLEQTRHIALLRVVGMTRRQIRKMVFAQAVILGLLGTVTGAVAGVNTAYVISLCMMPVLGYSVPFALDPAILLGSLAFALAIAVAAAMVPARRATRLPLPAALPCE